MYLIFKSPTLIPNQLLDNLISVGKITLATKTIKIFSFLFTIIVHSWNRVNAPAEFGSIRLLSNNDRPTIMDALKKAKLKAFHQQIKKKTKKKKEKRKKGEDTLNSLPNLKWLSIFSLHISNPLTNYLVP